MENTIVNSIEMLIKKVTGFTKAGELNHSPGLEENLIALRLLYSRNFFAR